MTMSHATFRRGVNQYREGFHEPPCEHDDDESQSRPEEPGEQAQQDNPKGLESSYDTVHHQEDTPRRLTMLQLTTEKAQVTQTDIAWAAGLFDGEGTIGVYRHTWTKGGRDVWALTMSISSACRSALEEVRAIIGEGSISKRKHSASAKTHWVWTVHSMGVERVMHLLLPYLRIKREQVLTAKEFRSTYGPRYGNGKAQIPQSVQDKRKALGIKMRAQKLAG